MREEEDRQAPIGEGIVSDSHIRVIIFSGFIAIGIQLYMI